MLTKQMTIGEALEKSTDYLKKREIDSPRLDAELLLAHVLKTDRLRLYLAFDKPLNPEQESQYRELIVRRGKREPVAYLCGSREFMALEFLVTPAVLIPRPETELLVMAALDWLELRRSAVRGDNTETLDVFEVGAGSGAISVALAWHWRLKRSAPSTVPASEGVPSAESRSAGVPPASPPQTAGLRIRASDISAKALEVARGNAERHQVQDCIRWIEADLFGAGSGPFDLILSNPPYVDPADEGRIAPDVKNYEPRAALFAGRGGMQLIERLLAESPGRLKAGGALFCEIGAGQAERVRALAAATGNWRPVEFTADLQGIPRVAKLELRIMNDEL